VLSLVGTPIGNLSDASPRVVATLSAADAVLCEDTRVTGRLLAHFDIHVPLERCDENVIASRVGPTIERLQAGERVAFVSDAGMPGVSDPGQRLVDAVLDAGLPVEVIPGPSAVTCAVALAGLSSEHFFFEGFLPRKAGEKVARLETLAVVPGALVVYESPHRVAATLAAIADVMPTRRVALIRELTKIHEEVTRDVAPLLAQAVAARVEAEPLKGECVIVVSEPGAAEIGERARRDVAAASDLPTTPDEAIRAGLAAGTPKAALARKVARDFSLPRDQAYDRVVELARER
jgi:16S rRNA (cytidine1402-2'-O)-methyltransferase